MIALSLFFATAIWSLGSLVLTCVGTEESRVDGVEPDAIDDTAAHLSVPRLEVDEVVVVDVPAGNRASSRRRSRSVEGSVSRRWRRGGVFCQTRPRTGPSTGAPTTGPRRAR